jgi:acyl-CoA thioesterase-1
MKDVQKIVCLGDSITYGFPYGPEVSWVTYVAQSCSLELINKGVNGNTIEDMARRYDRDVRRCYPDLVIILGGTNDVYCSEISRDQCIYHLENIVISALKDGFQPVIGITIPVADDPVANAKLEDVIFEERRLAEKYYLQLLDFSASFYDAQGKLRKQLYLDGVHPNRAGYQVMGQTALDFFQHYCQK